jgi:multiple sugar transport system permease protein
MIVAMLLPVYCSVINSLLSDQEVLERFTLAQPDDSGYTYTRSLTAIPFPISFDQYFCLLSDSDSYFFLFFRSLCIAFIITMGQILISITVGLFLGKYSFRGRVLLLILYGFILFMPYSATLLPNYLVMRELSLLNTHLSIILPAVFSPIGVILMTIFISNIPSETIESALLETKNIFMIIHHIIIPQIQPGIALTVIISFTEAWNMVEQPQTMLDNKLLHPLSMSLNSIFNTSPNHASLFLYMIPPFLIMWVYRDVLVSQIQLQTNEGIYHVKD